MDQENSFNNKHYPQVWVDRFNFFKLHGAPNTKGFVTELKALPFGKKMRVNFNWLAFFFGPIYFFIKGMWQGAITLIMIIIIAAIICSLTPSYVGSVLNFAFSFMCGMVANYTFYRKEVLGEDDFNIFKGMRL